MRALLLAAILALPGGMQAADTDSVDSVIKAVYEVISGPAGPRDWARFRTLFATGARLIAIRTSPQGSAPVVLTPEDYAGRNTPAMQKTAFYESEVARRAEAFGSIAHVFSTYESRHAPGEKPFARGINSFQLVRDNGGWKVMTILWDAEREGQSLPEKYLSSPKQ